MNTLIRHTEIRGVEAAWKQLYAGNRLLSPYQDYDFCRVVERYFALSILLRYENVIFEFKNPSGQAILLVPLHLRISNHQTEAYAWGEFSQAGYLDFIYGESLRADEFMEAMTAIARELGKVQFIISRVAERSRLNELIKASLMPEQYRTGSDPCVHIDLALKSVEYYEKLSKNTRQNLRTSLNRLEKDKLHFEIRSRTHEPVPLALLWRMTVIYWRRMAEKKITLGLTKYLPYIFRIWLNPAMVALNKLPNVYYSVLYIDKKLAAFCAGFISSRGDIVIPFLAINSRYSQYSPGGILITEEVKKLILQNQMGYFDLSRGNEKYKFDYGGTLHTNHWYEFCLDGKAVENRPGATRP